MIDSADLDICRLCFASKSTDGSVILNDFQGFESMLQDLAGVQIVHDKYLPQKVCSNCEFQLQATQLLKDRVKFTQNIWLRYLGRVPTQFEDRLEYNSELLLNCHLCGESGEGYDQNGLKAHITSEHGVHLFKCGFCTVLLNTTDGLTESTPQSETEETQSQPEDASAEAVAHSKPSRNKKIQQPKTEKSFPSAMVLFQCQTCDEAFPQIQQLKEHVRDMHTTSLFASTSHEPYQEETVLTNPLVLDVKPENPLQCKICGVVSSRMSNLKRHMKIHPGYHCEKCPQIFTDQTLLDNHAVEHGPSNTESQLDEIEHVFGQWRCKICGKMTARLSNMKRHIQVHTGFRCPKCPAMFTVGTQLQRHQKEMHDQDGEYNDSEVIEEAVVYEEDEYVPESNYSENDSQDTADETTADEIDKEEQDETEEYDGKQQQQKKLLQCKVCGKTSTQSWNLKRHMRTHPGFHCDKCPEIFDDEASLQEHMQRHSEKKQLPPELDKNVERVGNYWSCKICGKVASRLTNLKRHIQIHTGFFCQKCPERFTVSTLLEEHVREQHAKEGVIQEEEAVVEESTVYVMTVIGEEPFRCAVCGIVASGPSNLNRHMMTHSEFCCEKCSEIFPDYEHLVQHNEQVHSEITETIEEQEEEIIEEVVTFEQLTQQEAEESRYVVQQLEQQHQRQEDQGLEIETDNPLQCRICGKISTRMSNMKRHMMTHEGFHCDRCPQTFTAGHLLVAHKKEQHRDRQRSKLGKSKDKIEDKETDATTTGNEKKTSNKLQCEICGFVSSRTANLTRHMMIHTGFKCKSCPLMFGVSTLLAKHVREEHSETRGEIVEHENPNDTMELDDCSIHPQEQQLPKGVFDFTGLSCHFCAEVMPTAYSLLLHTESVHKITHPEEVSCHYCDEMFCTEANLREHLQTHSGYTQDDLKHICPVCKRSFQNIFRFSHHIKIHEQGPFRCDECPSVFLTKRKLQNHKTAKHELKLMTCKICGKVSGKMSNHQRHMQVHTGFKCKVCPKVFTRSTLLQAHKRKQHNGEGTHSCHRCGKQFTTLEERTEHNKVHQNGKLCGICGLIVRNLELHMNRHEGVRPFKCSIEGCDKGFITKDRMRLHERSHSDERLYPCSFCDKRLKSRRNLINHVRMHTGDKRYKCDYCPRSFVQSFDCVLHMRRHTGEKPYRCGNCGEGFIVNHILRKHQQTCLALQADDDDDADAMGQGGYVDNSTSVEYERV